MTKVFVPTFTNFSTMLQHSLTCLHWRPSHTNLCLYLIRYVTAYLAIFGATIYLDNFKVEKTHADHSTKGELQDEKLENIDKIFF